METEKVGNGGSKAVNDDCVVPPAKGIRCCADSPLSVFYYRDIRKGKLYLMLAIKFLVVHFYSILPFHLLVPIINASQSHLVAAISRRMGLGGDESLWKPRRWGNGGSKAVNDDCVVPPAKGIRCCADSPLYPCFYYRDIRKGKIISDVRFSNAINRGRYQ
ncbi:hypothetical protein TNIN_478261 [Trichonephila inaurata madagascariensis]|uniref:Uncharacterized protein n=1 Tax=Trichonephila inaurata madagascariensis TaxID=2747483 RepID=A0A8X6YFS7_9ARAC|nr:hypothetical protein TNIN_478261 [Trichonephila inaurata madagascariensis]